VNWFFTEPLHTLTIDAPQNLLALLLFVSVAITVSSVVHLGASRAADAARSSAEATVLLELARTVLGGADSPRDVLDQLTDLTGGTAKLLEKVGEDWVVISASREGADRDAPAGSSATCPDVRAPALVVIAGSTLLLHLYGEAAELSSMLLDGFAAQAAAALDRERLRTQAAQAEVLGEANRVRTALLTAVSHDLRTPLASVKAAVSSLRQADVPWSPEDVQALLATAEEGTDRLNALIGNLLDMSRVHTGSLQPFLRPTSIDEIIPLALQGLDGREAVRFDLPDSLPLVVTDPGLLERAVANLVANALRFAPAETPVEITARSEGGGVVINVTDHGPGVPADERERIFEPFQRLSDRSVGGVGLGLAVARGFVEAMGGQISATRTPGGGLTVRVRLRSASLKVGAS
jgi:two-component system sensor histidine kinase KdpD